MSKPFPAIVLPMKWAQRAVVDDEYRNGDFVARLQTAIDLQTEMWRVALDGAPGTPAASAAPKWVVPKDEVAPDALDAFHAEFTQRVKTAFPHAVAPGRDESLSIMRLTGDAVPLDDIILFLTKLDRKYRSQGNDYRAHVRSLLTTLHEQDKDVIIREADAERNAAPTVTAVEQARQAANRELKEKSASVPLSGGKARQRLAEMKALGAALSIRGE